MISVSRKLEVNPADGSEKIRLNRQQVWQGLVRKAENAVPYVEAITKCDIVEQQPERLIRQVVLHGETLRELILFFPEERVEFVRLSGHAKGLIRNIIEEDKDHSLVLRFTFDLVLDGVEPGSAKEAEFAAGMEQAYLDAVRTTLRRIREELSAQV
ncbi:SRPBCC family protein [Paraburkholderia oxyphila]|uniref:SRPBCC family protein n=1 Tax=Paraburkholderia oxyphila TaxID=614212 RepID=UPI000486EC75|nr:SRPBCC family protein [Paraburkholderia oxyphila]